jgi:hypothetical protein
MNEVCGMSTVSFQPADPSQAFFPVEMRPLYVPDGTLRGSYTELKRHYAVMDVERGNAFAVVTDEYKLVTNKDAVSMAEDLMKKVFQATKMSELECFNVSMPKTRSFCHIDFVHKSADFEPWSNDRWSAFLRVSNSYNRTHLLRFELGFCRWICMNGMIFGTKSIEFSYAHTNRGTDRIHRFAQNIGEIRKLEAQLTEKLHQLRRYHVPSEEMLAIACRAFDVRAEETVTTKPKRVADLVAFREQAAGLTARYFGEMGTHGYAALNVLTDMATRPCFGIAPEASMDRLQRKASSWMDDFVSAIKNEKFSFDGYFGDYRQSAALIESLQPV